MRRRILPFDVWLCLLLAALAAWGTGALAEQLAQKAYEKEVAAHAPVAGQIGGPAGESAFHAQSVSYLLTHDTFTVPSHGIEYRNRGAGYYDGKYFRNAAGFQNVSKIRFYIGQAFAFAAIRRYYGGCR